MRKEKQTHLSVPLSETNDQFSNRVFPNPVLPNSLTRVEKIEKIEEHFAKIMLTLGLDLSDDSLKNTPRRVATMYVNEIFEGLDVESFPKILTIENKMKYEQMILVEKINMMSTCEHHFQTFHGYATVAYIPSEKIIGLSKINRIVQHFSRRPQIQERLTKQIADCLSHVLETDHVAVNVSAKHFCVIARGIQDTHSATTTSDLRGDFKVRPDLSREFFAKCI